MATETRPDAAPLATQFEDAPLRDVPTGRGRSIAQRLLAGLLLISMLATAVATLGAFMVFRREAEAQRIAALDAYVTERAKYQQALFDSLVADQRGARLALLRELVAAKRSRAEDRFEALFPLSPDGARHAAPALWTGLERDDGASIYGVTGFMAPGPISTEERRLLVTAMEVVSRLGESVRTKTDNFYFYTLNDQMVMFAPDHPSKARFYAQAPASFTIADKPVAKVIQPGANPTRETRCTPLSPLMSDPTGRTLTTGCMTPVYLDGRLLGAFGSTLEIGSYLHRALADPAPDAENLVIDSNGRLIAFPGFGRPGELTGERVAAFERRLQPAMLASAIRAQSASDGVIRSPDGKNIIGYARIPGAGWYFLSVSPQAAISRAATLSSFPVLGLGALAGLAQCLLMVMWIQRLVARPLQRLADDAAAGRDGEGGEAELVGRRDDEIGRLAKALTRERRARAQLLHSLEDRVAARTAELNRANSAKTSFLATMSHELRTPLNGVIALSDVLTGRLPTGEEREMAQLVASSGRLLEQVLNDILDVSKIESGELRLDPEPYDLRTAIARIAELHRAAADRKGVRLTWRVAPEAPDRLVGDELRLSQIVSNLLSNAVKFTPSGEIELTVDRVGETLRIRVRDTGVGFAPEAADRLFRPFEQADPSITRRFGGTGLGLSICAALARLMGGTISAVSTPQVGSTFEVLVPLVAAPAEAEVTTDEDEISLEGVKVLLAEDHPTNQRVVSLILEPFGVELTIAQNGAEAIEAFTAGRFDLILMDVHMPEVDGLTATRRIRQMERETGAAATPIICLTADAMPEHVAVALEAGADRHMSKPIRPQGLLEAVVEILAGPPAPPPAARAGA